MSPDEFWGLSPAETIEWIKERQNGRSDLAMIQAWKTALWQRCDAKKFPQKIQDVIGRDPNQRSSSPQNVANKVMAMFKGMAGKS